MRWQATCIILLLIGAGCASKQEFDPLADRGELAEDIAAPSPEDDFLEAELAQPTGRGILHGTVVDQTGKPIPDAWVWLETVDLQDPIDNIADYEAARRATMILTDENGSFEFDFEEGVYQVGAQAQGYYISRDGAHEIRSEPLQLELRLVPESTQIIAHRGASFYAPENTIPAIRKAAHLGATAVELDVRLTWDRRIVVFHDETLERTTNGTGIVEYSRANTIRSLDAGNWFDDSFRYTRVPNLAEVLREARLHGLEVFLDVKASPEWAGETREVLIEELKELGSQGVTVAAFRKATVERCVEAGLRCAFISNGTNDGPTSVELTRMLGATTLLLNHTVTDYSTVQRARALGISLFAWTVNEPADWRYLIDIGVDGLLTDRPGYMSEFLAP